MVCLDSMLYGRFYKVVWTVLIQCYANLCGRSNRLAISSSCQPPGSHHLAIRFWCVLLKDPRARRKWGP